LEEVNLSRAVLNSKGGFALLSLTSCSLFFTLSLVATSRRNAGKAMAEQQNAISPCEAL
jgi:hypothetical protein